MTKKMQKLYDIAIKARLDYNFGKLGREEAMELINPYLIEANKVGNEIAKQYHMKFVKINFASFVR
jgi:hypothetical protein